MHKYRAIKFDLTLCYESIENFKLLSRILGIYFAAERYIY